MDIKHRFTTFFEHARPANAIPPDWDDLQFLWDFCSAYEPKTIVEYGTGCSSLIFAEAVRERGQLWAVESDPYWFKMTQSLLINHRPHAKTIFAPAVRQWLLSRFAWEYRWYPPRPVDLVYIDGPNLTLGVTITLNGLYIQPTSIIIDGRQDTVAYYKANLPIHYRRIHDDPTVFTTTP